MFFFCCYCLSYLVRCHLCNIEFISVTILTKIVLAFGGRIEPKFDLEFNLIAMVALAAHKINKRHLKKNIGNIVSLSYTYNVITTLRYVRSEKNASVQFVKLIAKWNEKPPNLNVKICHGGSNAAIQYTHKAN